MSLWGVCKDFFIKLGELPTWVYVVSSILAAVSNFYAPVIESLLFVLLCMAVDVLSAMWAESRATGTKQVIESRKLQKKIYETIPLALGVTVLLAIESIQVQLTAFGFTLPLHLLSLGFCYLCALREAISVLEKGAMAKYPPAETLAKILRIKQKQFIEKVTDDTNDESKPDPQ